VKASWQGNDEYEPSPLESDRITVEEKGLNISTVPNLFQNQTNLLLLIIGILVVVVAGVAVRGRGGHKPRKTSHIRRVFCPNPQCGVRLRAGQDFCSACGTSIRRGSVDRGGDYDDYDGDDGDGNGGNGD
jgi:hypothetical protein